jgi:hypothetical protein
MSQLVGFGGSGFLPMGKYQPQGKYVQSCQGLLAGRAVGLGCLGTSTRWTDEPDRPSFERHPARVRDAVALAASRLAASPDGLIPRSGETCADEAGDCVTTDPMDDHEQFTSGAVRTVGEQL